MAPEPTSRDPRTAAGGDPRLEAWVALIQAHSVLLETLERELQDAHDLPVSWYEVLLYLAHSPDGMRMQELARSVLLSKSGITRLIDRMESAGLVAREASPSDRRGTNAVITEVGRARLAEAAPTHLEGIERHFTSHLSDAEAAVLAAVLVRIAEANGATRVHEACEIGASTPEPVA